LLIRCLSSKQFIARDSVQELNISSVNRDALARTFVPAPGVSGQRAAAGVLCLID
jgi:hypothetical protein